MAIVEVNNDEGEERVELIGNSYESFLKNADNHMMKR